MATFRLDEIEVVVFGGETYAYRCVMGYSYVKLVFIDKWQ